MSMSKIQYFQNFEYEIKINIFKYVNSTLNLTLTCRNWPVIAKDPYAKAEWLVIRYGSGHALYHAVRLPTFTDIPIYQTLIAKKVMSRYFLQRLLTHFGKYDQKLIELKIEHNLGQLDVDRSCAFQQKIKLPWANNLPITIFTYLLDKEYKQLSNIENLPSKGNDMELIHYLSAGPHVINHDNLKDIKILILNKQLTLFPPRPKKLQLDLNNDSHIHQLLIPEEYSSKDVYENNRQLNVILSGILIHPDLIKMWKQIEYYEICSDLVMQGALLELVFPSTPASDWTCPSAETVFLRFVELRNLGFKLKKIKSFSANNLPIIVFTYLIDGYKQSSNKNDMELSGLFRFLATYSRVVNYISELFDQLDADRIHAFQRKIKSPWASNSSTTVSYSLDKRSNSNEDLFSKGNDMELFHYLFAVGPHAINYTPRILRKNLKDIKDLILNQKLVPFSPRQKTLQFNLNNDSHIHRPLIPEEYSFKVVYENNRRLNVILSGILIHPDLIKMWKQIEYYEIYSDVDDLVMQGALLILFPRTPVSDWTFPCAEVVISRLIELRNLGFKLKDDNAAIDALHISEHRSNEIKDILWGAYIDKIRIKSLLANSLFCAFQQKISSSWENFLPKPVSIYLLDEDHKQLIEDLHSKSNDMELSHFFSAPYAAPRMLRQNSKDIEDLILNKQLTSFPPRSKTLQTNLKNDPLIHQPQIPKEYLSKNKQLSFLRSQYFPTRPITVYTLFTSSNDVGNVRIHGTRQPSSNVNQSRNNQRRRQHQPGRLQYRPGMQNIPINNESTLNLIARLPQQVSSDPFIDQFFNGSSFI